jgi:hypothetical protein
LQRSKTFESFQNIKKVQKHFNVSKLLGESKTFVGFRNILTVWKHLKNTKTKTIFWWKRTHLTTVKK